MGLFCHREPEAGAQASLWSWRGQRGQADSQGLLIKARMQDLAPLCLVFSSMKSHFHCTGRRGWVVLLLSVLLVLLLQQDVLRPTAEPPLLSRIPSKHQLTWLGEAGHAIAILCSAQVGGRLCRGDHHLEGVRSCGAVQRSLDGNAVLPARRAALLRSVLISRLGAPATCVLAKHAMLSCPRAGGNWAAL